MDTFQSPLSRAIELLGLSQLERHLGVTYQAVRKWERRGRMPRTEWTGETNYSAKIEVLTGKAVTRAQLLAPWDEPPEPSGGTAGDLIEQASSAAAGGS